MVYINCKTSEGTETVDQFESRREARAMLREYQLSAPYMGYYLSTRSTEEWRESQKGTEL